MPGQAAVLRRFVSVQVPFADLRSALPTSARLRRPSWPDAAAGEEFVRGVGVVTSRRLGGSPVWLGEGVYCQFGRALRGQRTPGVRDVYVRLFGTKWGYRLDLGYVFDHVSNLETRAGQRELSANLMERTYSLPGQDGRLADLLRPLGEFLETHTSVQSAGAPQRLVRAGRPLILVEDACLGLEAPTVAVLNHTVANRSVDVVVTSRPWQSSPVSEDLRRARLFRLAWWRAHSEVDALRIILRAWNTGDLAASQELRDVLDDIGSGLSRWRSNGQDQSMIMAWQAANHMSEWETLAADAALLTDESKGLARKIEGIIGRARSDELARDIAEKLPPGATVNLEVFSTKVQDSQGVIVGSGTMNNYGGPPPTQLQDNHQGKGERFMDPVSLVVAAVVAGVTAGAGDVAKDAISDAYSGLKGLLKKLFKEKGDVEAERVLEAVEADPDSSQEALKQHLQSYTPDQDLLDAARAVLAKKDPTGYQAGKYEVTVTGSQGVQVGDNNEQTNTFNAPPPSNQ